MNKGVTKEQLLQQLNSKNRDSRLAALKNLVSNFLECPETAPYKVNNHIHSIYSFSPYSPTAAAYFAYLSGLVTAGIMDHDTVSGAEEFIEAGAILKLPTTVGIEARISFSGTFLENTLINNPDQKGVAYMALHGIPHGELRTVNNFFKPYRAKRNERNILMCKRIAALVAPLGIEFSFEGDVLPHTRFDEDGAVTERMLCYVLALKLIEKTDLSGDEIIRILENGLSLSLTQKQRTLLSDVNSPHYVYDLLGILKGGLVSSFYVDAKEECPSLKEFIDFGKSVGAIVAYAYLGDVAESVTGDKKAQKFEDSYLEGLFDLLRENGVQAIAYMPSRNNGVQLERLRQLCKEKGFFEISGEDINSSRQSFICKQLENPEFSHLITATWALIGHEKVATVDKKDGMFAPKTIVKIPSLNERIAYFCKLGKSL